MIPLPDSTGIWVMDMSDDQYGSLHARHDGCAAIGPKANVVRVALHDKVEGPVVQRQGTWTVQRGLLNHADAVALKRANDEFVTVSQRDGKARI